MAGKSPIFYVPYGLMALRKIFDEIALLIDTVQSESIIEQDNKSCFCQFIVSFIEILFTYSR